MKANYKDKLVGGSETGPRLARDELLPTTAKKNERCFE